MTTALEAAEDRLDAALIHAAHCADWMKSDELPAARAEVREAEADLRRIVAEIEAAWLAEPPTPDREMPETDITIAMERRAEDLALRHEHERQARDRMR